MNKEIIICHIKRDATGKREGVPAEGKGVISVCNIDFKKKFKLSNTKLFQKNTLTLLCFSPFTL